MYKNSLYLGILFIASLLLGGCSLLPEKIEPILTEEDKQTIQLEISKQPVEKNPEIVQPTTKPTSAPTSATTGKIDLPSLESDLGSITLEEERFE